MFAKKISIIAITLLVSIIMFGCSSKSIEDTYITLNGTVSKDSTYLIINNNDEFVWDKAEVKINDEYIYKADFLAKGKSSIELREFTKKDGERFNPTSQKVLKVTIYIPKTNYRKDGFWTGAFK